MMAETADTRVRRLEFREDEQLWEYLPLGRYRVPPEPPAERVRRGLRHFWRRLRPGREDEDEVEPAAAQAVSADFLDTLAPEPDWRRSAAALHSALEPWLDRQDSESPGSGRQVQTVVAAPYGGLESTLELWAQTQGWRLLCPPSRSRLADGGGGVLEELETPGNLVIPNLAGYFLKEVGGLDLVRRLIDALLERPSACLLGCDAWAWAYLKRALGLDLLLTEPLTLAPFEDQRLQAWFRDMAGPDIVFRQAASGARVVPAPGQLWDRDDDERSRFLVRLARYSRGIPGVARAVWRSSLRVSRQEEGEGPGEPGREGVGKTVWVQPWSSLDLPPVLGQPGHGEIFVIHALLIHGGLDTVTLVGVLPLVAGEVKRTLHKLRLERLVENHEGVWRVTVLGYAASRAMLSSEGYMTDDG